MALVAGIDSSTQSTEGRGQEMPTPERSSRVERVAIRTPSPPRSEQDPLAWWDGVRGRMGPRAGAPRVEAISVAGQRRDSRATDEHGTPVRPAKLWNDTETDAGVGWLIKKLGGPAAWADAVGKRARTWRSPSPSCRGCTAPRQTPGRACATFCLPHDWLTLEAHGAARDRRGDASGTGYWSPIEGAGIATTCSRSSARTWIGRGRCSPVLGPSELAGEWTAGEGRPKVTYRHWRQHGRRPGHGARRGRDLDVARHLGNRVRRERSRDERPTRVQSQASLMRQASSSLSCAR